uniref:Uncharacterized protein n=1 Tax=Neolamprologus brichardi TaxID=32507 RepID=A0A3Q4G9K3_NEOBR
FIFNSLPLPDGFSREFLRGAGSRALGAEGCAAFYPFFSNNNKACIMATDVGDDREMREAQRDYLDFLDDDVSLEQCY